MTDSRQSESRNQPTDAAARRLVARAQKMGFACGRAPIDRLHVNPAVRAMCASNRCHSYGRNWTCPPASGALDVFQAAIAKHTECVIVQTIGQLEDEFDTEGMAAAENLHKARFAALASEVQDAFDAYTARISTSGRSAKNSPRPVPLAAGACTLCPICSYPSAPCRHPAEALVSMEAAGLLVSEVCNAANMPYYHGRCTVSFTSCILL